MADKSKDTGTGGINIDGKVQTMDVGVPDSEAAAQKPADYSSGDIAVDKSVKDISKPARETFAKYLSKSTLGIVGSSPHKNVYPVGSGEGTQVDQLNLKDANGNPTSPGSQNNENKFATGFNSTIASNNPAGIKRGLATGRGPDGNTLLPNARQADGTLVEPLNTYTANVVDRNLYDYDSSRIEITDGTLNLPSSPIREIRKIPYGFPVDGGSSQGILSEEPDYALPDVDRFGQPGSRTSQNFFPIEFETEVVKPWDVNNKPISVTAAQNNATNAIFFTKIIKIVGEGDNQKQVVDTSLVSTYTPALITSTLKIKRGQTANESGAIDGNKLLTQIAPRANAPEPNQVNFTSLSSTAGDYTSKVVDPNLYDYNSTTIGLVDGTVGSAPTNLRDIRIVSTDGSVTTDGGTSKNILGPDNSGNYTLTSAEARSLAGSETSSNSFPIQSTTDLVTLRDSNNLPVSVTAAQTSFTNANFFTKVLKIQDEGENQQQVVSALQLPTYTEAFISAITAPQNPFQIKRGRTAGVGSDGHTLLANIAPKNSSGDATLTLGAKTYTQKVIESNLNDYDTTPIGLTDGALGEAPSDAREDLKYIPADSSIKIDGGRSTNILGADDAAAAPDYTLTLADRATQASIVTAGNFFKLDAPTITDNNPSTTKIISSTPLSATDAQNNPFNSSFFTKEVQKIDNVDKVFSKLRSSYTDALTTSAAEKNNPFIIKRGKTEKTGGTDGNSLLSTVAPETAGTAQLTDKAKTYVDAVLKPNLNDVYNPKVESTTKGVAIPEYESNGSPSRIRSLNKTTTFVADAGTSKSILDGLRVLTFLDAVKTIADKTLNNAFPITAPAIVKDADNKDSVAVVTISASDGLTSTKNPSFFEDVKIGTSFSSTGVIVNSKGKLKKDNLPDGNSLLSKAATPNSDASPYVKFAGELNSNLESYTTSVLDPNLYSPFDKIETPDDKSIIEPQDFFGPRALYKPTPGSVNLGRFDNIASNPTAYAITKNDLFDRFKTEIQSTNVPGAGNEFKPNVENQIDFSFVDENGYPASPTTAQNNSENKLGEFTTKPPTSYSEDITSILLRRGKSEPRIVDNIQVPDGNSLLNDRADGTSVEKPNPVVASYVSSITGKNRYNSDGINQFVPADTPGAESVIGPNPAPGGQRLENISDEADINTSFVERTKLYAPSQLTFGQSPRTAERLSGVALQGYTFRRLTRLGTILQLRAAGEAVFITGADDDDPRDNLQQLAAALVPGLGQAGAGIPLSREYLNVKEIIKNLPDDTTASLKERYIGELIDIGRNFEGTLNTSLEKFSGFSALGLIILAIVLVVVIILAFLGIAAIAGTSSSLNQYTPSRAATLKGDLKIHGLGTYQGKNIGGGTNLIADLVQAISTGSGATALFGIKPTFNREYLGAVQRGSLAFFGVDFTQAVPPLLAFPGHVVVTARAIIRGVSQLVIAIAGIGNAFASGNIFSAIFQLIDLIEIIRNSRVIKALNTFSQLGDQPTDSLLAEGVYEKDESKYLTKPPTPAKPGPSPAAAPPPGPTPRVPFERRERESLNAGMKISEVDSVLDLAPRHKIKGNDSDKPNKPEPTYIGISQVKNRLQNSTNLAWASYRSPSVFLSKRPTDELVSRYAGAKKDYTPNANYAFYETKGPENRIPSDYIKEFEDAMDGEYVPFYFQDLRTNEMLVFHAFLLSISDDYSASYESISGLGRAEPVRVYKETQRKLGLSFMLAATDVDDFDHMWDKINRLTMLVYPQYTAGKTYTNPGTTPAVTFQKPFTQQIAAGPMVRMRLGNLFRSNYSTQALAKMFGLNSGKAAIPPGNQSTNPVPIELDSNGKTNKNVQDPRGLDAEQKYDADKKNYYKTGFKYKINISEKYICPFRLAAEVAEKYNVSQPTPPAAPPPAATATAAAPPAAGAPSAQQEVPDADRYFPLKPEDIQIPFYFEIKKILSVGDGPPEMAQGNFRTYANATPPQKTEYDIPNTQYYIPVAYLLLDPASQKKYDNDKKTAAAKASVGNLVDIALDQFMLPANNAIVRSFESTSGKGIAGFIESLAFDWYDKVTWDTTDIERKAPKMCKVTISFAPVHDIAPGLDSEGYNRAPIYPLGPYRHGIRKVTP